MAARWIINYFWNLRRTDFKSNNSPVGIAYNLTRSQLPADEISWMSEAEYRPVNEINHIEFDYREKKLPNSKSHSLTKQQHSHISDS